MLIKWLLSNQHNDDEWVKQTHISATYLSTIWYVYIVHILNQSETKTNYRSFFFSKNEMTQSFLRNSAEQSTPPAPIGNWKNKRVSILATFYDDSKLISEMRTSLSKNIME